MFDNWLETSRAGVSSVLATLHLVEKRAAHEVEKRQAVQDVLSFSAHVIFQNFSTNIVIVLLLPTTRHSHDPGSWGRFRFAWNKITCQVSLRSLISFAQISAITDEQQMSQFEAYFMDETIAKLKSRHNISETNEG